MDKYQIFAINQYLTEWPEGWSFERILEEIKAGDPKSVIEIYHLYESIDCEELAGAIEAMTSIVRMHFR